MTTTIFQLANINDGLAVGLSGNVINWDLTSTKIAVFCMDYQRVIPTNGFSQTIANGISALVLKPAGALLTGTITMPSAPQDGQNLTITTSQDVTTLTLSPNTGQSINGLVTTLTSSTPVSYKWVSVDSAWYRI